MIILACFSSIGFVFNVILYLDDINNRGGILDKVDKSTTLQNLITSPVLGEHNPRSTFAASPDGDDMEMLGDDVDLAQGEDDLMQYKDDKDSRQALKKYLGKQGATR